MQGNLCPTAPGRRGTLSATDGVVPSKSLCLQAVPEFLLKMYTRFQIYFSIFSFDDIGTVANLKKHDKMVNFYCLVGILIVKYRLI